MLEEQRGASTAEELLEDLGFDTLPIVPKDVADSPYEKRCADTDG